jgi:hypothetical protein
VRDFTNWKRFFCKDTPPQRHRSLVFTNIKHIHHHIIMKIAIALLLIALIAFASAEEHCIDKAFKARAVIAGMYIHHHRLYFV